MDASVIHQRIEQARERLLDLRKKLLDNGSELPDAFGRPFAELEELTNELIVQSEELQAQLPGEPPERAENGEDLLEIEQVRLTAIIETTTDGILVTDAKGQIVLVNQSVDRILDRPVTVGDRIEDLATADYLTLDLDTYPGKQFPFVRSILERQAVLREELYLRLPNKDLRRLLVNSRPLVDHHKNLIGVVGIIHDVTEQYAAETQRRLKQAEEEAQRLLARQREIERAEIAREIHDGPIQHLTLIRFNLEQALSMSYPNPSLEQIMRQINSQVDNGIDELRTLCNQLRPPTLAPYGLEKAIRAHAREIRERYIAPLIELDLEPDRKSIHDEARNALFRIYQEAITNIIKHAKAGEVHVTLRLSERWAELTISDDGVGFRLPAHWVEFARQQHFGLVGMIERADAVGGRLNVRSAEGKGTLVQARVPLQPPKTAEKS